MQVFTKDIIEIYRLRIYIEYTYQDIEPSEVIGSVALEKISSSFWFCLFACSVQHRF